MSAQHNHYIKNYTIQVSHCEDLRLDESLASKKKKHSSKWQVIFVLPGNKKRATQLVDSACGRPVWNTKVDVKLTPSQGQSSKGATTLLVKDSEENHIGQVCVDLNELTPLTSSAESKQEQAGDLTPRNSQLIAGTHVENRLSTHLLRCANLQPTRKNSLPHGRIFYWAWVEEMGDCSTEVRRVGGSSLLSVPHVQANGMAGRSKGQGHGSMRSIPNALRGSLMNLVSGGSALGSQRQRRSELSPPSCVNTDSRSGRRDMTSSNNNNNYYSNSNECSDVYDCADTTADTLSLSSYNSSLLGTTSSCKSGEEVCEGWRSRSSTLLSDRTNPRDNEEDSATDCENCIIGGDGEKHNTYTSDNSSVYSRGSLLTRNHGPTSGIGGLLVDPLQGPSSGGFALHIQLQPPDPTSTPALGSCFFPSPGGARSAGASSGGTRNWFAAHSPLSPTSSNGESVVAANAPLVNVGIGDSLVALCIGSHLRLGRDDVEVGSQGYSLVVSNMPACPLPSLVGVRCKLAVETRLLGRRKLPGASFTYVRLGSETNFSLKSKVVPPVLSLSSSANSTLDSGVYEATDLSSYSIGRTITPNNFKSEYTLPQHIPHSHQIVNSHSSSQCCNDFGFDLIQTSERPRENCSSSIALVETLQSEIKSLKLTLQQQENEINNLRRQIAHKDESIGSLSSDLLSLRNRLLVDGQLKYLERSADN